MQVVINHNTPGLPKIYIHRVGRTARAGEQSQVRGSGCSERHWRTGSITQKEGLSGTTLPVPWLTFPD